LVKPNIIMTNFTNHIAITLLPLSPWPATMTAWWRRAPARRRTAQIQPGVFFTFEAPFIRILTLYSNTLEDPGVLSDKTIGDSQLTYLRAALTRAKKEKFKGALIIAHHHPAYTG
jgi:hypothetical protein